MSKEETSLEKRKFPFDSIDTHEIGSKWAPIYKKWLVAGERRIKTTGPKGEKINKTIVKSSRDVIQESSYYKEWENRNNNL